MFLIGEFGFLALGVCQHYTTPTDHRSIYLSLFTLWALMAHIIYVWLLATSKEKLLLQMW